MLAGGLARLLSLAGTLALSLAYALVVLAVAKPGDADLG